MKVYCPKNKEHNQFITTAHEIHDWVVDEEGNFIRDLGCIEVTHKPDPYNCWTCETCRYSAKIKKD